MKTILKSSLTALTILMLMMTLNLGTSGVANAQISQPSLAGEDCSGGSCTLYRLNGNKKCDACCPSGKNPSCTDIGGCSCA